MLYLFPEREVKKAAFPDPLALQIEYAKHIGMQTVFNENDSRFIRERGTEFPDVMMLRTTYDFLERDVETLEKANIKLLESSSDIRKTERWYKTYQTKRPIAIASRQLLLNVDKDFISETFGDDILCSSLFVKPCCKCFNAKIPTQKLLNRDEEVMNFLFEKCKDKYDEYLISPYYTIKSDYMGKKEARFIIINGCVVNASRYFIYPVEHTVPNSLRKEAERICAYLADSSFPKSYALDIALFCINGEDVADAVEFNPVSCSMCYANNSIFDVGNVCSFNSIGAEYSHAKTIFNYPHDLQLNPTKYLAADNNSFQL